MKPKSTLRSFLLAAGSSLLTISQLHALDGAWNVSAAGATHNWTDATIWASSQIADGTDFTANFTGIDITGDKAVSLNATDRTIGNITFTDATTSSNNLTISGHILTLDVSSGAPVINVTDAARRLTISSQISGNEGLTKSGLGALTLSGSNNYTGITTVDNGTLTLGNAAALGATGTGNGTLINGSNAVQFFGTVLNLGATGLTLSEPFSLKGNAIGRATIHNNAGVNHTLNGNIDVTSDTTFAQIRSDSTGSITVNSDISGAMSNSASFFIRGDSFNVNNRLLGSIDIGTGAFTKGGAGTWTIGATTKTYAWGGTILVEGTLRMGLANVMPSATAVTLGQASSAHNATLELNGFSQTVAGIQLAAGSTGTKTITSTAGTPTLTVGSGSNFTYGGVLAGTLALTKTGTGTLQLNSASNTYAGGTNVNAGSLVLGASGTISDSAFVTIKPGATLDTSAQSYTIPTGKPVNFSVDGTGSGSSGKIKATALNVSNATVTYDINGPLDDAAYVLAEYTSGSLTGTFLSAPADPAGYTLNYAYEGNKIALVATGGNNYLSWAASQVPPVTGGVNGDDDNDGVNNLVEYALADGGERGVLSGNTITFTKRAGVYGSDLTYIIETSETLVGTWSDEVTHGPGLIISNPTISYTFTPGSPVKRFARLEVVATP